MDRPAPRPVQGLTAPDEPVENFSDGIRRELSGNRIEKGWHMSQKTATTVDESDESRRTPVFRLELDLRLYFVPLMSDTGNGITVTRTIELPFAPQIELGIAGR